MAHKIPLTLRTRYLVYGALYGLRKNIAVSHDERFFGLYKDVTQTGRLTMNLPELYNIFRLIQQCDKIPGDVAELGVYRGASAKVLAETKGEKQLHLFDTFAGLPEVDTKNDQTQVTTAFTQAGREALALQEAKFSADYEDVKNYLAAYRNVQFHVGVFPETAKGLEGRRFSFVHLDADIYSSTLAGLDFFYPRLSRGGVLISHDYGTVSCPGVKKAFTEFMKDKPEMLIELWDTQVMLIKS
jgi:O-methyltransferase